MQALRTLPVGSMFMLYRQYRDGAYAPNWRFDGGNLSGQPLRVHSQHDNLTVVQLSDGSVVPLHGDLRIRGVR